MNIRDVPQTKLYTYTIDKVDLKYRVIFMYYQGHLYYLSQKILKTLKTKRNLNVLTLLINIYEAIRFIIYFIRNKNNIFSFED